MQVRVKYSVYKNDYNDCKVIKGTYDKNTKTVEIVIPDTSWEIRKVVKYSIYKKYYTEYKILKGSYDPIDKTVVVLIPPYKYKCFCPGEKGKALLYPQID